MTMCYFRLFTPKFYSNFSKILFSHLHNIYQIQIYLATKSTKVHKLDLDLVSQPDICLIILLGYLFSIALDTARGCIDFCFDALFSGPSSGNGSPIGRSNSTTKVYFVGKEVSPIVQTNVNGQARHSPAPSESNKFNKV